MTLREKNIVDILNEIPLAIIAFDKDLNVFFVNKSAEFFPGIINAKNIEGENLAKVLPAVKNYENEFNGLKKLLPFEVQIENKNKTDGIPLNVLLKCVPLEKNGKFDGGIIVIEDMVILAETSGFDIVKTKLFGGLLQSLGFGFALVSEKGELIFSVQLPAPLDEKSFRLHLPEILKNRNRLEIDGKTYETEVALFPKKFVGREIYIVVVKDVTEKIRKINTLENELQELRVIVRETQSVFHYNKKGEILKFHVDEKSKEIFEKIETVKNITDFVKETPKEDLFVPGKTIYLSITRKKTKNYFKGRIFELGDNFILTLTNISEDLNKLYSLTDIYDNFELFLNNSDNFVWTAEKKDGKLRPKYYTPNVEKIIGYSADELLTRDLLWYKIIHPNDRKNVVNELRRTLNTFENKFIELEFRIIKKDHTIIWVHEKIQVLYGADKETLKLIGSAHDITKTKEREEKILKENKKLREINEAKDRFISIISHDLRSPFSSILGFTKLMLEQETPPEKTREYISYIQNSAESMLNLVNALLDWTRLQTGRIKFVPTKVSLYEIVKSSVEMLLGTAIQKGVKMETLVPRDIYVHGDKNLLLQVFNNLLGNAVKFTRNGDTITVAAEREPDGNFIKVSVKDTGVGIKEQDLPKLFKVDSKFTNPGTAGEKGTGLGLSLVNEIIKKHGGEIRVESVYGKGTEFIFTLPVSSSVILLADDNPAELILYSKLIKSLFPELKLVTASTTEEIEKHVKEKSPRLVVSELNVGDANIEDLLGKYYDTQGIKPQIIVLAREISDETRKKLTELGITDIFSKPVDLTLFRAAISNAMKR